MIPARKGDACTMLRAEAPVLVDHSWPDTNSVPYSRPRLAWPIIYLSHP